MKKNIQNSPSLTLVVNNVGPSIEDKDISNNVGPALEDKDMSNIVSLEAFRKEINTVSFPDVLCSTEERMEHCNEKLDELIGDYLSLRKKIHNNEIMKLYSKKTTTDND
jgi:hypothetical protein